jgi:menaquinone-dependent protoporphyrinogen IX oxidase
MKQVLIAYTSHSGSTREIAEFLGNELSVQGQRVDVLPISEVTDISPYESIIAGGLLYRFGWHPEVIGFLTRHLVALRQKKVALFITGMRLVKTPDCDQAPYPVFIDPSIMPEKKGRRNPFDSYTTMKGYLNRVLPTIEKIRPVSLGFFAGKVNLQALKLPEKLILGLLMLLTGKHQGDYRNWASIRIWANGLGFFEEELSAKTHENIAFLQ